MMTGRDMRETVVRREVRARERPRAVILVYLWELAWALLVATPIHAWAKRSWGAHPDGDAVLFRAGARELSTWFGGGDEAASVVVRTTLLLLFVGAIAGQVPLAALVAALIRRIRATQALAVGVRAWLPLCGVLFLATFVELLLIGGGMFAATAIDHSLRERMGDARAFGVRLAVFAFFVVLASLVGVVADLARVAVARDVAEQDPDAEPRSGLTVLRAGLGVAFSTMRRRFGTAFIGWSWRMILGVLLLGIAWVIGSMVGGRGGIVLLLLFLLHQGIVFVRTALRASWLAHALRLTSDQR
jgi:hypothetical protein